MNQTKETLICRNKMNQTKDNLICRSKMNQTKENLICLSKMNQTKENSIGGKIMSRSLNDIRSCKKTIANSCLSDFEILLEYWESQCKTSKITSYKTFQNNFTKSYGSRKK